MIKTFSQTCNIYHTPTSDISYQYITVRTVMSPDLFNVAFVVISECNYFRFKEKNSSLLVENWVWPQLDIGRPAVQSLGLEGFFSFFGPFLFHVICP